MHGIATRLGNLRALETLAGRTPGNFEPPSVSGVGSEIRIQ